MQTQENNRLQTTWRCPFCDTINQGDEKVCHTCGDGIRPDPEDGRRETGIKRSFWVLLLVEIVTVAILVLCIVIRTLAAPEIRHEKPVDKPVCEAVFYDAEEAVRIFAGDGAEKAGGSCIVLIAEK